MRIVCWLLGGRIETVCVSLRVGVELENSGDLFLFCVGRDDSRDEMICGVY